MTRIFEIRSSPARASSADSKKLVDMGVLQILINAVINDTPSSGEGPSAGKLKKNLESLLDAVNSKITNSSQLFDVCHEYEKSQGRYKAALDFLLKSYVSYKL